MSDKLGFSISVVIPAYFEEKTIGEIVQRCLPFADEVLVINDGSTDDTSKIAKAAGARVVDLPENRGALGATQVGLKEAQGDIIITLDGDHSYPVDSISYLIEALIGLKVGFVSASRFPVQDPESMSKKNMFGNIALSLAASLLFLRWIRDSQSGASSYASIEKPADSKDGR